MADAHQHSGIHRLAVIGVGLMGGSLALAARSRAAVDEVVGFDTDQSAPRRGAPPWGHHGERPRARRKLRPTPTWWWSPRRCAASPNWSRSAPRAEPRPRLISDMGSTKSAIIASLSPLARSMFIGGHPICGAATSGVRYASADLFEGATYFLCTTGAAFPKLYEMLQRFVARPGSPTRRTSTPALTIASWPSSVTCRTCWPTC